MKSLLQWVVAGLDELDQAAAKSDSESLQHAITSTQIFPSIQLTPVSAPAPGPGSPPLEPAKIDDDEEKKEGEQAPYSPELPAALGRGLGNDEGGDDEVKRARFVLPPSFTSIRRMDH